MNMEQQTPGQGLENKVKGKRVIGRVRSWDDATGIGSIANPLGDVFVHYTNIDQEEHPSLEIGQTVEYDLETNAGERNRTDLIATHVKPIPEPAEGINGLESITQSELITGKVKWWDERKGFGFICNQYGDVFVHHRCIDQEGFRDLSTGQTVEYRFERRPGRGGNNGLVATYVKPHEHSPTE